MKSLIGAHLPRWGIDAIVEDTGVDVVQVFLNSPRTWDQSKMVPEWEAANWREWDVPVYVHSSYLVNPASANPAVREMTLVSLQQQLDNAAHIGAKGLVVHAGHASGYDVETAVHNWGWTLERIDIKVPILIENTAGGRAAPGRTMDGMKELWDRIGHHNVGIVLDTCHAWAGNMGLEDLGARALAAFGRVDLLHLNGSLDDPGSGRDRHSNLWNSQFGMDLVAELALTTGAPCILEVPGPREAYMQDLHDVRLALWGDDHLRSWGSWQKMQSSHEGSSASL